MFDAIIRGSLGEIGSVILDFYIQNALWINGILLLYAIILMFARRGYSEIKKTIIREFTNHYGESIYGKSEKNFRKSMEQLQLNWESIAKQTRMPIISIDKSLFFKIKSPAMLRKHFTPEKVYSFIKNERLQM